MVTIASILVIAGLAYGIKLLKTKSLLDCMLVEKDEPVVKREPETTFVNN